MNDDSCNKVWKAPSQEELAASSWKVMDHTLRNCNNDYKQSTWELSFNFTMMWEFLESTGAVPDYLEFLTDYRFKFPGAIENITINEE